ncbi:MAG: SprT-like domain-containing protein [Candidatus Cyclobacteriaceae bacterium M2_1C_046]
MNEETTYYKINRALQVYVPATAVHYCFLLWNKHNFTFKITKPRHSKAGDYRFLPSEKHHIITINKNLNKYSFLLTYIHEVAHLVAFEQFGRKIAPHGLEWKKTFIHLMRPLLRPEVFPEDVLKVLYKHFQNPKASTSSDPTLVKALSKYDPLSLQQKGILLDELPHGSIFQFRTKVYQKLEKRRTRILCEEQSSKRRYLISKAALVEKRL